MDEKLLDQLIEDTMNLEKVLDPKKRETFISRYMEPLDVVDETGNVIGSAPRGLIHRIGLRHRTVFILLLSSDNHLLLQTRASSAISSPLRLDISVGGHVISGETDMIASASREMLEEMGFPPDTERLKFVSEYNRDSPLSPTKPYERNRERRVLFEYQLSEDEYSRLNVAFDGRSAKADVESFRWFEIEEVLDALDTGRVADGLGSNFVRWLSYRYSFGQQRHG